ncbi:tryptophan synthase alpha chain [Methanolinea mesophila]|uniref:tryptophan synthase subunit alpha n=1 Tax=Methanolinea mesophila TaxID=547055 RepID=UPI001AE88599|nr:tryptophan synthase subunit alpha [Methanolinea mesophila]MBP1929310.1 tryptophan synthase alpha chain [Methanolinea mesophila]
MSRIERTFSTAGRPVFIGYLVAGDPDYEQSLEAARTMLDAGVDILEIGMPFTDPLADGPTIQQAHQRALEHGMTQENVFRMAATLRREYQSPIVLLVYANHLYARGIPDFYRSAASAGVDGILVVDLPLEESEEAQRAAEEQGIDHIFLVAPTTKGPRLNATMERASGFIYLISVLGITGARNELSPQVLDLVRRTARASRIPVAVGFGISKPEHIAPLFAAGAGAIIVGSAIVDIIGRDAGRNLPGFITAMRNACDACAPKE